MEFQVTVRHGGTRKRYHLVSVTAGNVREAMALAVEEIPDHVASRADLVEIRPAAQAERRVYLGEEG